MKPVCFVNYHGPNPLVVGECGSAYITADIDAASSEQLNKFNEISMRVLRSLSNLVSSCLDTRVDPPDDKKKSRLTFSIFLAGNHLQEEGQYDVRAMSGEKIFEIAKGIIAKEEAIKDATPWPWKG